jgi:hypothetical protein
MPLDLGGEDRGPAGAGGPAGQVYAAVQAVVGAWELEPNPGDWGAVLAAVVSGADMGPAATALTERGQLRLVLPWMR